MTIIQTNISEATKLLEQINDIATKLDEKLEKLQLRFEEAKTQAQIDAYKQTYILFWANAVAICEEAGTDAHILFTKHVEMGQAIKERMPAFVELTIPENWTVEFVQDGSVIPTYTAPVIEE